MNPAATLHRFIYLLRRLKAPYSYPSKLDMVEELQEEGFQTSIRTFERDLSTLQHEYGILITYDRQRRGYYWKLPEDEDIGHFDTFLQLLERKERLDFLSNAIGADATRYLMLEQNNAFQGMQWLPQIWEAMRAKRVVQFNYQSYDKPKAAKRLVEPNLVVEDRNRWYLVGWDRKASDIRSFGLDRMGDLQLTAKTFTRDILHTFREQKKQIIGMTIFPEEPLTQVVLRFTAQEAPYVKASPLHFSQKIVKETKKYVDFALEVKLNYELERDILGYGEEVEVLEPARLRNKIKQRLQKTMNKYR